MNKQQDMPEFMAQVAVNLVNKRFDITERQYEKLKEIEDNLKIPPSAIVRIALNCFLPKAKNENFKYGGINELWGRNKF